MPETLKRALIVGGVIILMASFALAYGVFSDFDRLVGQTTPDCQDPVIASVVETQGEVLFPEAIVGTPGGPPPWPEIYQGGAIIAAFGEDVFNQEGYDLRLHFPDPMYGGPGDNHTSMDRFTVEGSPDGTNWVFLEEAYLTTDVHSWDIDLRQLAAIRFVRIENVDTNKQQDQRYQHYINLDAIEGLHCINTCVPCHGCLVERSANVAPISHLRMILNAADGQWLEFGTDGEVDVSFAHPVLNRPGEPDLRISFTNIYDPNAQYWQANDPLDVFASTDGSTWTLLETFMQQWSDPPYRDIDLGEFSSARFFRLHSHGRYEFPNLDGIGTIPIPADALQGFACQVASSSSVSSSAGVSSVSSQEQSSSVVSSSSEASSSSAALSSLPGSSSASSSSASILSSSSTPSSSSFGLGDACRCPPNSAWNGSACTVPYGCDPGVAVQLCGCDGTTYNSPCEVYLSGIKSYSIGACSTGSSSVPGVFSVSSFSSNPSAYSPPTPSSTLPVAVYPPSDSLSPPTPVWSPPVDNYERPGVSASEPIVMEFPPQVSPPTGPELAPAPAPAPILAFPPEAETSSSTSTDRRIPVMDIEPFCGDGRIDPGEECDPPNLGCSYRCMRTSVMGISVHIPGQKIVAPVLDKVVENISFPSSPSLAPQQQTTPRTAEAVPPRPQEKTEATAPLHAALLEQPTHAPVGNTGPATLAVMAAGAAGGFAFMRRKRRTS